MVDTKGVIYKGRTEGMNEYKAQFASDTKARTLAEAVEGCDVLLGCSVKGQFDQAMVKSMAKDPIVFALANPDPEISYPEAKEARADVIMATGRSDYPNQVNNVLGFPYIFRGALDVRATAITEEMKMAAARALAELAKQDVPDVGLARLRRREVPLRPRLHHPQAARPARAALGGPGRRQGRHGRRRGPRQDRPGRVPRAAAQDAEPLPPGDGRRLREGPPEA